MESALKKVVKLRVKKLEKMPSWARGDKEMNQLLTAEC